jgi:hypothetical protein
VGAFDRSDIAGATYGIDKLTYYVSILGDALTATGHAAGIFDRTMQDSEGTLKGWYAAFKEMKVVVDSTAHALGMFDREELAAMSEGLDLAEIAANKFKYSMTELEKSFKDTAEQAGTDAFIGFFEAVGSAAGDTDKFTAALQKLAAQLISQIGKELVLAGVRVISADPVNPVAWGLGLALMAAGGLTIAGGAYMGSQGGGGGGGGGSNLPHMASGGIVDRPTLAVIGESGPEAVIPLGRGMSGGTTIIVQGSIWAARDLAREIASIQGRW